MSGIVGLASFILPLSHIKLKEILRASLEIDFIGITAISLAKLLYITHGLLLIALKNAV